jgi:hypothetical protein
MRPLNEYKTLKFHVVDLNTNKVIDENAICTPFMLADWPGRMGEAVKRNGFWSATDYPGFKVKKGETVMRIKIREVWS